MTGKELDELVNLWINDSAFRTQVRKNPEAALRGRGVKLTKEELEAVKAVDWVSLW